MKIAVNTRFLLKDKLEGIGRFTYEVLKRMVEQHPEDEFIFFFDRSYDKQFVFSNNVISVVLSPPARHPFLWYFWFENAIPKALKKYQPDVFFSPDGFNSLGAKVKTVMVTHDIGHYHYPKDTPYLVRKFYNSMVPKYLRKADGMITVSTFVKRDIVNTYYIEEKKIAVACNACNSAFTVFSESEKKNVRNHHAEGQDYFLYTGAIHPRKNVDQLIKSFDLFKRNTNEATKLLLAGRMAWKIKAVQKAFQNSPFQKDIIFLGYVPEQELVSLMAAAKCFILISKHEGFGIPLLEAMQSGVPIICSNTSALAEVAGNAALQVSPDDTKAIADAMQKIWYDEALRKTLIHKGHEKNKQYTWERAVAVVYDKLKEMVDS